MGGHVEVWGWNTARWVKLLVDNTGHLQVDITASALPAGAATAANQATIIGHIDTLETISGRMYGFDTANWQYLQVEAAAQHNLRVRLYGGVNAVGVLNYTSSHIADANYGLVTHANLRLASSSLSRWYEARVAMDIADGETGITFMPVALMGWNGGSYDRLRVESGVAFNLRVKLYDGANGIDSQVVDTGMTTERGLAVCAAVYGYNAGGSVLTVWARFNEGDAALNAMTGLLTINRLYGYNGATWDRLRTYPTGILKVGRAEVGLLDVRLTAAGPVGAAGARRLYWMLLNPSAGSSAIELTDAIAAGAAIKADHFDTTRDGHMVTFDPPLEFSIGIYLETFTNMTSIIFGYL